MTGWRFAVSFASERTLLEAVDAFRRAGIRVRDVCAPYAVEVPGARLPATPDIPRACVLGGVAGAIIALGFQVWTSAVSWPMDLGGKPALAWLAFAPVTLAAAVLGAGLATAWAFLRAMRGRGRPEARVDALPDRFTMIVEGNGPDEERRVRDLCGSLRADALVALSDSSTRSGPRLSLQGVGAWRRPVLAVTVVMVWLAVVLWPDTRLPERAYANEMAESPAVGADARSALDRPAQAWTISRSGPVPLHLDPGEAGAARAAVELRMPELMQGPAVATAGNELYVSFCQPCHGRDGHGDGPTIKRGFQPPPSLLTQRARDLKDGQLFHVLTFGQKLMPAQAGQLSSDDRWRVLAWVRELQQTHPVDPPPFGSEPQPATTQP